MKDYQAYIFDLYGTLVDIHTDEARASFWKEMKEVFASYGAIYSCHELKQQYLYQVRKQEDRRKEEGHEIEIDLKDVFEVLLEDKGVVSENKVIEEIAWRFRQASTSHLRLYKGAIPLLQGLHQRGKKVFLLSNAQHLFTMKELEILQIYDLFDEIFLSSDYGYKKPDPVFFQFLLNKYALKGKDCLMIGNDLYCDIYGAYLAGMDSYYIHSALSSETDIEAFPTYQQKGMDLKKVKKKLHI